MKITYSVGTARSEEVLRLPRRRDAAPTPMPAGWYEQ